MIVGHAAGRPDSARLAALRLPLGPDAEDLHDPKLPGVGNAQGFGAAAGRKEPVCLHEIPDEPDRLARSRAPLQGEDLGLLDGHDLPGDAFDEADAELLTLRAGALADRQLTLVHLGIPGMEIGEGFSTWGTWPMTLLKSPRAALPVVSGSEIDHPQWTGAIAPFDTSSQARPGSGIRCSNRYGR
jgi:hypothetical protein